MKVPFSTKYLNSRAGPKNSLNGSKYSFFFGSTSSGKVVWSMSHHLLNIPEVQFGLI